MEDLQIVERVAREDPSVIEQCGILGIPKEDMHKVYCDRKHSTSSSENKSTEMLDSLDHWLRRALWQQGPSTASADVLQA